jgi:hypothetical protein
MRLKAYESATINKERMNWWYDKGLQAKEFKEGGKVLHFNSKFKIFGKGKLKSKWDGPYVVHSVSPSRAVMIMDIKGGRYVVNGRWLKVFLEPDVMPIDYIDIYTMKDEPERQG